MAHTCTAYLIALENRIEQATIAENTPYSDIEVDGSGDRFGTTYRVWCGTKVLGTFYRSLSDGQWVATPFYRNGKFADTRAKSYRTHTDAQAAIVRAFRG